MKKISLLLFLLIELYSPSIRAVTISEILENISRNNLTIKASKAAADASLLALKSENALPGLSVEYSPFFEKGYSGAASSELIVSQEFDFPSLYFQRSKAAALEEKSGKSEIDVQRNEILLQAKQLCLDLILLHKKNEILQHRLNLSSKILQAYEKKENLGAATRLEVNKIKLDIEELNREQLQNNLAEAEVADALIVLNGGNMLNFTNLDYDINPQEYILPGNIDALVAADPKMIETDMKTKVSAKQLQISKSGWLPSLNLGYRRNTEDGDAMHGMLIGASFPIYSAGKKIKAAKAEVLASEILAETTARDLRATKEGELRQLRINGRILSTYNMDLLNETLELYDKSLNEGTINLIDYYMETSLLYDRLATRAEIENTWQKQLATLTSSSL